MFGGAAHRCLSRCRPRAASTCWTGQNFLRFDYYNWRVFGYERVSDYFINYELSLGAFATFELCFKYRIFLGEFALQRGPAREPFGP